MYDHVTRPKQLIVMFSINAGSRSDMSIPKTLGNTEVIIAHLEVLLGKRDTT
jgi:hypothetical protein